MKCRPSQFEHAMPSQVRNALIKFWGNEDIISHPEIIVELGPVNIIRIKRIGRKSLHLIAESLQTSGYIDAQEQWLRGKS